MSLFEHLMEIVQNALLMKSVKKAEFDLRFQIPWLQYIHIIVQFVVLFYKPTYDVSYRLLTISHASERFIYAYGKSYNSSTYIFYGLYVFDPITLKLKMAFLLENWNKYYGFNIAELNSDAIYSINNSTLYR